jgi:hypothetical protein
MRLHFAALNAHVLPEPPRGVGECIVDRDVKVRVPLRSVARGDDEVASRDDELDPYAVGVTVVMMMVRSFQRDLQRDDASVVLEQLRRATFDVESNGIGGGEPTKRQLNVHPEFACDARAIRGLGASRGRSSASVAMSSVELPAQREGAGEAREHARVETTRAPSLPHLERARAGVFRRTR